jgi:hypothetical protein
MLPLLMPASPTAIIHCHPHLSLLHTTSLLAHLHTNTFTRTIHTLCPACNSNLSIVCASRSFLLFNIFNLSALALFPALLPGLPTAPLLTCEAAPPAALTLISMPSRGAPSWLDAAQRGGGGALLRGRFQRQAQFARRIGWAQRLVRSASTVSICASLLREVGTYSCTLEDFLHPWEVADARVED